MAEPMLSARDAGVESFFALSDGPLTTLEALNRFEEGEEGEEAPIMMTLSAFSLPLPACS